MRGPRRTPAGLGTAVVLGVGLGGFVDGILFHQILRWHHLISSRPGAPTGTVSGLRTNVLADGLFHAAAWVVVVAGAVMLWRGARRGRTPPASVLTGGAVAGWGIFTVFDGVVLHLIANLHNLREGPHETAYDLPYIALGLALAAAGLAIARRWPRPAGA